MNNNYVQDITKKINGKTLLAFSYQAEDIAVLHLLLEAKVNNLEVFTIDTGKLFPETQGYHTAVEKFFNISIKKYYPVKHKIEKLEAELGEYGMRESLEKRHLCCQIRKVDVLDAALEGRAAWVTGMRRGQSVTRTELQLLEFDEKHLIFKINPLYDWTHKELMDYIAKNNLPLHPLYAQGFTSIGCVSCTRAVQEGEDIRAGRWWWEKADCKECGLHVKL
ncbi:phosphoadenosine phosphosulfate reductase [Spirochaetia bacterium]|nr:phosphoadenosine phosphosulfate reductase [Spirochaetia bacterium]